MKQDETASTHAKLDVVIPDSLLAREVAQLIRDTESELLFNHSTRVYLWGALLGKRKGIPFDSELLYVASMFHDIGLTSAYRDGADTLRAHCLTGRHRRASSNARLVAV